MMSEQPTNGRVNDTDNFDVLASLRTIRYAARHNKWLIRLTIIFSLVLVTVYVIIWPPIFKAEATLMVERDTDTARDHFYEDWNVFRKDDARTEMELISAGPVLKEVVEKEHLRYDDVYHPFMSHLSYLWQSSWPGRNYKAMKKFILRQKPRPDDLTPEQEELARTIMDMKAGISMEPVSESNVGRLTVKGPSKRVATVTNTLISVYLKAREQRYHDEAQGSYSKLEEESAKARQELTQVADKRRDYAEAHNLTFDFQKETAQVTKLAELELDIASAHAKVANMEASLREVEDELTQEPSIHNASTVYELNTIRESAKAKRLDVEASLISTRTKFREDSPEVAELKNTMAQLDSLIANSSEKVEKQSTDSLNTVRQELATKRNVLRTDLQGSRAGLAVMEKTASDLRARLKDLPAWQTQMREYDRDVMLAQQKYEHLGLRREQASVSVDAASIVPSMRVVELATAPDYAWWPRNKILFPSTIAVAYLIGLLIACIKSYVSGLVRREHVEHGRGAVPLYGVITGVGNARPFAVENRASTLRASSAGQD